MFIIVCEAKCLLAVAMWYDRKVFDTFVQLSG